MTATVIQLEKDFQKLARQLVVCRSARLKLHLIYNFYRQLQQAGNPRLLTSYYQELLPHFLDCLKAEALVYSPPEFISVLKALEATFTRLGLRKTFAKQFEQVSMLLREQCLRISCHLGEWETVIKRIQPELRPQAVQAILAQVQAREGAASEQLQLLAGLLEDKSPQEASLLKRLAEDWRAQLCFADNVVPVLLVERNHALDGELGLGNIQSLSCTVELKEQGKEHDVIVFEYPSETTSDLMFHQAYDALHWAREQLFYYLPGVCRQQSVKVSFSMQEQDYLYTGDSMGAAMGLLLLAQLSRVLSARYQFSFAADLVTTGALEIDGTYCPVDQAALAIKLSAFFYSPHARVLVPQENRAQAEEILQQLVVKHPGRRYEVLGFDNLSQVLHEPTIVLRKRVKLPRWILLKRRRRWLVGILIAVCCTLLGWGMQYLLKDRNPAQLAIIGSRIIIENLAGESLWEYDFGEQLTPKMYRPEAKFSRVLFKDFDDDGKTEVIIGIAESDIPINGNLFFFEEDGRMKWRFRDYPKLRIGGEEYSNQYWCAQLRPRDFDGDHIYELVAIAKQIPWFPTRVMVLDVNGNLIGHFWNSGHIDALNFADVDRDSVEEIIFGGTNNEYDCAIAGFMEYNQFAGWSPQQMDQYSPDSLFSTQPRLYFRFPVFREIYDDYVRMHILDIRVHPDQTISFIEGIEAGCIVYHLDFDFGLLDYGIADGFGLILEQQYGKPLSEVYPRDFLDTLLNRLEYWNGQEWVLRHE
jgi:hypothetical protein